MAKKPKTPKTRAAKKTTSKPRTRNKEKTHEKLILAGLELFAERGLDAPSLDDICAHAGVTRGAFYVSFEDRDDFLLAVMDHVGAQLDQELFAGGDGSFGEAVQRFVSASATGRYPLMPKGGIRPYQLLDACARSATIRERYLALVKRSQDRVASIVEDGQSQGSLRSDISKDNAGLLMLALVVGLQTLADLGVDIPLPALAGDLVRLVGTTADAPSSK